ncbi:hypothetical protein H5410_030974 [Solanum commersonii]|uniref:Uncharacterized protein n=1 Tax=Solanum commersonii TaxID=4109 RepID=A0A9J5YKA5_SOLCO|nr:hypothetical protein H5410_030974 [Solanum commersonii]
MIKKNKGKKVIKMTLGSSVTKKTLRNNCVCDAQEFLYAKKLQIKSLMIRIIQLALVDRRPMQQGLLVAETEVQEIHAQFCVKNKLVRM